MVRLKRKKQQKSTCKMQKCAIIKLGSGYGHTIELMSKLCKLYPPNFKQGDLQEEGAKMGKAKINTKKIITTVVGVPATLVVMSELTDLNLWWLHATALIAIFGLMGWWGLLKPTKYDKDGYAVGER